jgi:hypothetical protein
MDNIQITRFNSPEMLKATYWLKLPGNKKNLFSTVGDKDGPCSFHNYCCWCIGCRTVYWQKSDPKLPYNSCWGDPYKLPKIVFVACSSLKFFFKDIYPHIPDYHNYILIIADHDYTIPINQDLRFPKDEAMTIDMWNSFVNNKQILHIFASHLIFKANDRFSPIPVGFNPLEHLNNDIDTLLLKNINNDIMNRSLIMKGCCRIRNGPQWNDRVIVKKLCNTSWSKFSNWNNISTESFFDEIQKYSFLLCPHGGGIDPNPKAFSAIYCCTIPIMKRFINCEILYADLPVVFIDDWKQENITLEKLKIWREELKPYFYDKKIRQQVLEKLTSEYWLKYIYLKLKD